MGRHGRARAALERQSLTVSIEPACMAHASFVTANLRKSDREEIYCQLPDGFRTWDIAAMMIQCDSYVAYLDDEPVLFFGAQPLNAVALQVWAMGTKRTARVLVEATRFILNDYMPKAIEAGFLMAECRTHVEHRQAHRWLESTGAVVNGTPFVYGKNSEKFVIYRWGLDYLDRAANRYKVSDEQLPLDSA